MVKPPVVSFTFQRSKAAALILCDFGMLLWIPTTGFLDTYIRFSGDRPQVLWISITCFVDTYHVLWIPTTGFVETDQSLFSKVIVWLLRSHVGFGPSSIVITFLGKRELVAVLAVCSCPHFWWVYVFLHFLLVPGEGCDHWLWHCLDIVLLLSYRVEIGQFWHGAPIESCFIL